MRGEGQEGDSPRDERVVELRTDRLVTAANPQAPLDSSRLISNSEQGWVWFACADLCEPTAAALGRRDRAILDHLTAPAAPVTTTAAA